MKTSATIVSLLLCFLLIDSAIAQIQNTPNTLKLVPGSISPKANIEEIAWLAGQWSAESQGGIAETIWTPPMGGAMMGMYRLVRGDSVVFYEFRGIVEEKGSLVLKIKHFTSSFIGWEARDNVQSFPLVKLTNKEALFEGFTIRRTQKDSLQLFVAVKMKDNTIREIEVMYHLVSLAVTQTYK